MSYKIKIKDTHPRGSISNRFFNIDKGQIVTVDENFPFNPEVFDKVDENTKSQALSAEDVFKILDIDVEKMKKELLKEKQNEDVKAFDAEVDKVQLTTEKPVIVDELVEFKKRVQKLDLNYKQLQQILDAERKGIKRKNIIEYLESIPEPKESGINISEQTQFLSDLRSIEHLNDKAVRLIVKTFENKENLISALKENDALFSAEQNRNDFTPQAMERLKKHYGLIKSVVTTTKTIKKALKR